MFLATSTRLIIDNTRVLLLPVLAVYPGCKMIRSETNMLLVCTTHICRCIMFPQTVAPIPSIFDILIKYEYIGVFCT